MSPRFDVAESGEPVAGASVELWHYPPSGGRHRKRLETCTTDEDGNFVVELAPEGNYAPSRSVRVVKDGAEVLSLGWHNSVGFPDREDRNYEFVELFTDRSLYRPGQAIQVKGIAYHADPSKRDFHTWGNESVFLKLIDPNGKEVASKRLRTNKWGSFVHTFTAPSDRLTGAYRVQARSLPRAAVGATGGADTTVSVEEYNRP